MAENQQKKQLPQKKVIHLGRLAGLAKEGQHAQSALPWLDLDGEDAPVRFLFTREVDGKERGMIAEGNLHTIKGIEKAGKSAVGLALIAAVLRGEFIGIKASRPDLRVLWIDTEQDRATLRQKGRAALAMAERPEIPQNLFILTLRGETEEDRRAFTRQAIQEAAPDLVFLDGVVDLCVEFNDEKASRAVINELMAISESTGAAIVCVIHTNRIKSAVDDALKARGHLGTLIQQKSAEVYQVDKIGKDRAEVALEKTRFAPIERPLAFFFKDGFRVEAASSKQSLAEMKRALDLWQKFKTIFGKNASASYKDLCQGYVYQEGKSASTAKKTIAEALQLSVLWHDRNGKNTLYYLMEGGETGGAQGMV